MSKALKNKVKLNDTVSVKDFGALGDGATDDTAAIASAIASLSGGGGTVLFPVGVYVTDPIVMPTTAAAPNQHAITLRGQGATVSILKPLNSGANYSCIKGQTTLTPSLATAPNRIQKLGFMPHASGNFSAIDMRNMSYTHIEDIEYIDNGTGRFTHGIYMSTIVAGSATPGSAHCYDNKIDGVRVNNQTYGPITLVTGVDTPNVVDISHVSVNGTMTMDGIVFDATATALTIRHAYFEAMQGTCIKPCDFTTIEDSYFELCVVGVDGTGRTTKDVTMRRCYFNSAPNTAVSTYRQTDCFSSANDLPLYNLPVGLSTNSTWTTNDTSGAGLSFTSITGQYTRIGRTIICTGAWTYPVTADVSSASFSLPFAVVGAYATGSIVSGSVSASVALALPATNRANIYPHNSLTPTTNAQLSGQQVFVTMVYFAA